MLAVRTASCKHKDMWRRFALVIVLLLLILGGIGYRNALADPIVRRATLSLPGWPQDAAPLRVLLLSDIHAARPDMPPARLAQIVEMANVQRADVILIAGDVVSERWLQWRVATEEIVAPLSRLRARLGVYAVYGNHDHWRGQAELRRFLKKAGITPLRDEAVRIGPIILGGIDDSATDHSDFEGALQKMRALGAGPLVMLSHGTDYWDWMAPDLPLMLAGHTHCGQIGRFVPPLNKLPCGVVAKKGHRMIVSAGLGTSILPVRFNAPPDMWLITLGR